uniref:Maestro heat-like repeat family member 1 n=1 Tax=Lates calcarifer TaxID=8187 RepID=A0A4W6EG14_LATCA
MSLFCCVFPLEVTLALLDAANDKDSEVQEQVRKSMLTLGKQQPDRVLAMCQDYLLKHPKLVVSHRVVILQTIELIASCRIDDICSTRIKSIISLASDEMTRSKVIPDWQQAASNILVAVGNKHINDIMEEILTKFQPGVLPHFFVVQTLANLSISNVYGMVPFLNAILGTMLPMLSMAKQDNMKWVFSSALCHFSDSILEYLANLDKAPDPTVRKDTFSSEIYAAFDILFSNWLQSRESKLRLTVAEAVGSMCHLMASDKLEEQIPKLIPAILSLYKKNNEHYVISKSLCQVLDASVNMGSRVLETQLDSLLFALHQQVSAPTDYNNPPTVKNHNEVLRCFSLLANSFPDRLVMFVLQKLENSNERSRMGSLAVLRHLINSTTSTMETKKLLILASIRQPMADHSNKVKKRVVQVISAMAHHGYLELEGGELLVRFIVQHCALPDTYQRPTDPEEVTNEALRAMCDSTLHLLTTTVGRLADVLWPKLLYYLTPAQYSNATTPLCKSLIVLGNKKKNNQEPSFNIDFTQEGISYTMSNLCPGLCPWFQVNAAFPFNSRGHGAPSLSVLEVLSTNIHPKTEILWEKEIPPLFFLYRCIGVTLQQCFNKEVVKKQLQEILLTARHNDAVEREGVAMGIGLCANSHLEGTLAKLDEFGKSDAFKKSPSIFNLLKDRNDVEVEKVKSTLILCYGQVALNAPPETILHRIDQDILRCISKHFNTKVLGIKVETKDLTMKLSLIQSVGLIGIAISECVKKQGYIFSRKQELINVMLDFIKAEPADSLRTPVRHLVMTTCANLILAVTCPCKSLQALYKDTLAALQELLKSVLAKDPTPDGLQSCQHSLASLDVETGTLCLSFLLFTVQNMVSFHNLGALLGRLSPRCSDPHPAVRAAAVDCIYTLLYIQLRYEGFSLDYKDEGVDGLLPLKDRLQNPDHSILYKTCSDLTKVMSKRLPQQQLTTLVFMLFEGLVDSQTNCCRASSVILNTLLKNRGGGMQELVTHILTFINLTQHLAVGQTVLILASQHLQTVINTLVNQPLPYDSWTSEMWMALGADPIVANQIIEMVMEKLVVMAPYVDKKESMIRGGTTKVATNQPLAVSHKHSQTSHSIVECLCPSLNNIYECQRITVTAFFSELLNHHVVTELMLIDVLMNNMMERISDPCCTVRMLAVRGLGNIAVGSPEKVHRSSHTVLRYRTTTHITLTASFVLIQENDEIRCASIHLMGNLSKFGSGEPVFKDQIHNVLVSLLLHLVDPNPHVVKACKYAMRVCAPVVGSEQITTMFQNHLHDDKSLHYGEFINDLTKYLIQDFPGMLNFYHISVIQFFKSNWPEVRAGAAMFIGMTATQLTSRKSLNVKNHFATAVSPAILT